MTQSHPSAPRRKVTFTAPSPSQLQQIQIHAAHRCPIFTIARVTTTRPRFPCFWYIAWLFFFLFVITGKDVLSFVFSDVSLCRACGIVLILALLRQELHCEKPFFLETMQASGERAQKPVVGDGDSNWPHASLTTKQRCNDGWWSDIWWRWVAGGQPLTWVRKLGEQLNLVHRLLNWSGSSDSKYCCLYFCFFALLVWFFSFSCQRAQWHGDVTHSHYHSLQIAHVNVLIIATLALIFIVLDIISSHFCDLWTQGAFATTQLTGLNLEQYCDQTRFVRLSKNVFRFKGIIQLFFVLIYGRNDSLSCQELHEKIDTTLRLQHIIDFLI